MLTIRIIYTNHIILKILVVHNVLRSYTRRLYHNYGISNYISQKEKCVKTAVIRLTVCAILLTFEDVGYAREAHD